MVQMATLALECPIGEWIDVNAEDNEQGYPESIRLECNSAVQREQRCVERARREPLLL